MRDLTIEIRARFHVDVNRIHGQVPEVEVSELNSATQTVENWNKFNSTLGTSRFRRPTVLGLQTEDSRSRERLHWHRPAALKPVAPERVAAVIKRCSCMPTISGENGPSPQIKHLRSGRIWPLRCYDACNPGPWNGPKIQAR